MALCPECLCHPRAQLRMRWWPRWCRLASASTTRQETGYGQGVLQSPSTRRSQQGYRSPTTLVLLSAEEVKGTGNAWFPVARLVQGGEVQWAAPWWFPEKKSEHPVLLLPQGLGTGRSFAWSSLPCFFRGWLLYILWFLAQMSSPPQTQLSQS